MFQKYADTFMNRELSSETSHNYNSPEESFVSLSDCSKNRLTHFRATNRVEKENHSLQEMVDTLSITSGKMGYQDHEMNCARENLTASHSTESGSRESQGEGTEL